MAARNIHLNHCCSNSWSSMKATMGDLINHKKIVVLVEWGLKSDPAIAKCQELSVPLIGDLAKKELDRKAQIQK